MRQAHLCSHGTPEQGLLVAASPFEMRVKLAANRPETDVRSALASGDMGFLHSYTTGSALDGPGMRVVAWTSGCTELGKYRRGLEVMHGGLAVSGGEPLLQRRFVFNLLRGAPDGNSHRHRDQWIPRRRNQRSGSGRPRPGATLPFHQLGRFKWHALGIRYLLEDTPAPTAEEQARACEIFRAAGLRAH